MSGRKGKQEGTNDPGAIARHRGDWAAVLFALVFPAVLTWVYFVALGGAAAGVQQAAYGVGKVIQFGFPLVWVLAVRRGRLRWQGPGRAGVGAGLAFGAAVLVAMLVVYHAWLGPAGALQAAAGPVRQKLEGFGLNTLQGYVALGAFYSLAHSLLEELYWRWFVFGQLRRLIPLWPAVAVSSVGFAAHHVIVLGRYFGGFTVPTVLFSLAVAFGGAFWAWLYHRSGSLWGPWLSHLLVDAGIFAIGYGMIAG